MEEPLLSLIQCEFNDNAVRQVVHPSELLESDTNMSKIETSIAKLKCYNSPGSV